MEEKKEIRKKIFKARKEHEDAWIQEKSRKITETLTQLPEYRNADRIMAYADYNHEVITRYIIEQAWKDGKEVAVPKVFGKDMIFYRLTDFSQLEAGYFGIPEPREDGQVVSWKNIRRFSGLRLDFLSRCFRKYLQNQRISVRRLLSRKNKYTGIFSKMDIELI